MRENLKTKEGQRLKFRGIFEKFGKKPRYRGGEDITLCLINIKLDGKIITDHLWFNFTKGFQKLKDLKKGDFIYFEARIKRYYKGYISDEFQYKDVDFRLSHPTNVRKTLYY